MKEYGEDLINSIVAGGMLDAVFDGIGDGVCLLDGNLQIIWANETFKKWFGEEHRIYGKHPCKLYQARGHLKGCPAKKALRKGKPEHVHTFRVSKKGILQFFHVSTRPIRGIDGKFQFLVQTVSDVTEHIIQEERLEAASELNGNIVRGINEGLMVIDKSYRIDYVNDNLLDMIGWRRNAIVGKKCFDVLRRRKSPCTDTPDACPHHISLSMGRKTLGEQRYATKDGEDVWFEVSSAPMEYEDGRAKSTVETLRDITKKKNAEEAARELIEKYSRILDSGGIAVSINEDKKIIFSSRKFARLAGTEQEELYLKRFDAMLDEESKDALEKMLANSGKEGRARLKMKSKDGKARWIDVCLSPRAERGKFAGADIVGLDVSEETSAKEHEAFLKQVIDNSMDAITYYTAGGEIRILSKKAERLFALKPGEAVGKSIADSPHIPNELASEVKHAFEKAKLGQTIVESETYRKDTSGDRVFVSAIFAPFTDADGKVAGILEICRENAHIRRFKKQIGRKKKEIDAIDSMSYEMVKDSTSDKFLRAALVQCAAATDSFYAAIIFAKKEGGLSIFYAGGEVVSEEEGFADHPFLSISRKLVAKAAASKSAFIANNVKAQIGDVDVQKGKAALSSVLSYPLVWQGRSLGILAVGSKSAEGSDYGEYDESDKKIVGIFANAMVLAIQRDMIALENVQKGKSLQSALLLKNSLVKVLSNVTFGLNDNRKDYFIDEMCAEVDKLFRERYRQPQTGLDLQHFAQALCGVLNDIGGALYIKASTKNFCSITSKYAPWGEGTYNLDLFYRLCGESFTRSAAKISKRIYVNYSSAVGYGTEMCKIELSLE